MKRFNHAYDFAFEVVSNDFYAKDVTPQMIRGALILRATRLSDEEIMEATNCYDTFPMEEK